MAKSKARFSEVDELSDTSALEHSRGKYARYQEVNTKGNDSDEEDGRNDVRADYKSKHTLDSDEEEDVKYRKLDVDKVCHSFLCISHFSYFISPVTSRLHRPNHAVSRIRVLEKGVLISVITYSTTL